MWAWRARPSRPLTYAAIAVLGLMLGYQVVSRIQPPAMNEPSSAPGADPYAGTPDEDFDE